MLQPPSFPVPPSSQVGFSVFMNVVGSAAALAMALLYSLDLKEASLLWMCDGVTDPSLADGCRRVALLVQVRLSASHLWGPDRDPGLKARSRAFVPPELADIPGRDPGGPGCSAALRQCSGCCSGALSPGGRETQVRQQAEG